MERKHRGRINWQQLELNVKLCHRCNRREKSHVWPNHRKERGSPPPTRHSNLGGCLNSFFNSSHPQGFSTLRAVTCFPLYFALIYCLHIHFQYHKCRYCPQDPSYHHVFPHTRWQNCPHTYGPPTTTTRLHHRPGDHFSRDSTLTILPPHSSAAGPAR